MHRSNLKISAHSGIHNFLKVQTKIWLNSQLTLLQVGTTYIPPANGAPAGPEPKGSIKFLYRQATIPPNN